MDAIAMRATHTAIVFDFGTRRPLKRRRVEPCVLGMTLPWMVNLT
jgi:hypothetical protein